MRGPPRLATALLLALLPPELRDPVAGDLEEQWRERRARGRGALLWYWGQVLTLPYRGLRRAGRRMAGGDSGTIHGRGREGMGASVRVTRLVGEMRRAVRALAARPSFSLVTVGTLAVSIGAATLVFSVLQAVLLRPLPYPEPDRLVRIHAANTGWRDGSNPMLRRSWDRYHSTVAQLEAWAASGVFASVGASRPAFGVVREGPIPEEIHGEAIVEGFFETVGVRPLHGRWPTEEELARGGVVVVSHRFWSSRLGADESRLGSSLSLDGEPWTIVGVMPPGFHYPAETVDLWRPLADDEREYVSTAPALLAVGRMREGMEAADADEAVRTAADRLAERDPAHAGISARAIPLVDEVVGGSRPGLRLLFVAVGLILAVAAVNLANLVLARSAARGPELGVRVALGAGRGALVATLVGETAVLCAAGGLLGLALARLAVEPAVAAARTAFPTLPRTDGIAVDGGVLAFCVLATALVGVGASLPSALAASRKAPARALAGGAARGGVARGRRRVQRGLLVAESALTVVMLAAAALLVHSFARVSAVDPGFEAGGVAFMVPDPPQERYPDAASLAVLQARLEERVAAVPGVVDVSWVSPLPGSGTAIMRTVRAADAAPESASAVTYSRVGTSFFEILGVPLLAGRDFDASDGPESEPVILLSRSLAGGLFGGERQALGRRVAVDRGPVTDAYRVVGVVEDARNVHLQQDAGPHFYLSEAQAPGRFSTLVARTTGDPERLAAGFRAMAADLDGDLVVEEAGTLAGTVRRSVAHVRMRTALMAGLAGLAVVLALVGIAGVVAQWVEAQRRDIGVRIALGAGAGAETARVVSGALLPTAAGVGAGVVAALAGSAMLERYLYEVPATDPLTHGVAASLLLGLAVVAAWIPARRAARVDPARTLSLE